MRDSRRLIQLRSYALAFAIVLSPALLQFYSCDRGDTYLLFLELDVNGEDQIPCFDINNRLYAVTVTDSSTAILTLETRKWFSVATYQWIVDGETVEAGMIGNGWRRITLDIPNGESKLTINVRSEEGSVDAYTVDVHRVGGPVTRSIAMFCSNDVPGIGGSDSTTFELTVDSQWVGAAQSFDAQLTGFARVPETLIDAIGELGPAVPTRVAIVDGSVPVVVRAGATGANVDLLPESTPTSCAVDANGNFGPGAGPYPACDPVNDVPSLQDPATGLHANTDCVGLGGIEDSLNPCAPFVDLTIIDGTSDACAACIALDATKGTVCQSTGFCSTADALSFPLTTEAGSYVADVAPDVLFGFSPYQSPPPVPGPGDGLQVVAQYAGSLSSTTGLIAFPMECVMGVDGAGPLPDSELLSLDVHSWNAHELISTWPSDNYGHDPQLAVAPNGDALAVWEQSFDIYANRLTSGVWGGPELLETNDAGPARLPVVEVAANGDAVVVWAQSDGVNNSIYANRLTSGVWGGAELLENDDIGRASYADVAVNAGGDAVVVWERTVGTISDIYANRLTSGVWGVAELIETDGGSGGEYPYAGAAEGPQAGLAANGDAVVVWSQRESIPPTRSLYGNRLTSGVWGEPELLEVSGASVGGPSLAVAANGDAVVVWKESSHLYARRFSTSLGWLFVRPLDTGTSDTGTPLVTLVGADGDTVVTWSQGGNVYTNRWTSGAWGGPELVEGVPDVSGVAIEPDGDALVVWGDRVCSNSRIDAYSKRRTSGVWDEREIIGAFNTGRLYPPRVGMDANGNALALGFILGDTEYSIYAIRLPSGP